MNLFISNGKLETNILEDVERVLGSQLPPSYREFMLSTNGGVPIKDVFDHLNPATQKIKSGSIKCFFSIAHEGYETIQNQLRVFRNRIPSKWLPIASTSNGDIVCIGIVKTNIGKVAVWKHEYAEMWDISDSFTEFVSLLRKFGDDF